MLHVGVFASILDFGRSLLSLLQVIMHPEHVPLECLGSSEFLSANVTSKGLMNNFINTSQSSGNRSKSSGVTGRHSPIMRGRFGELAPQQGPPLKLLRPWCQALGQGVILLNPTFKSITKPLHRVREVKPLQELDIGFLREHRA